METREKIIERLMKVKALADHGVSGEREAAEQLLTELMRRYNLSEDDLNLERPDWHIVRIKEGDNSVKIFHQICFVVCGKPRIINLMRAKKRDIKLFHDVGYGPADANAGVECTAGQLVEIMSMYEFYIADFERQLDVFYYAYLDKNNLLLPGDQNKQLTDHEIEIVKRASYMSAGIERSEYHKQLNQ